MGKAYSCLAATLWEIRSSDKASLPEDRHGVPERPGLLLRSRRDKARDRNEEKQNGNEKAQERT